MLEGSKICHSRISFGLPLIAQLIKNLPAMQETPIQFLGQEVTLEKRIAEDKNLPGVWETQV